MYNPNYDKFPDVRLNGISGYRGWEEIAAILEFHIQAGDHPNNIMVLECYHGVLTDQLIAQLNVYFKSEIRFLSASDAMFGQEHIEAMVYPFVTDDPVFGHITSLDIDAFFDPQALGDLQLKVQATKVGFVCIYGTGASLVCSSPALLVYADMPRWEIQLRFRKHQVSNLGTFNLQESFSYQYKRAYFVDWRVCDKLKKELLPKTDFILDTTDPDDPRMIAGETYFNALEHCTNRPFRVVPFFDPGPWGGQWLKEICDLDRSAKNYAWGFDCVPEENSLLLHFDNLLFETPAINLVFFQPDKLLGGEVKAAFGAEFPIRFDFLDTMQGGNLSLQVHPLKEYIREQFGMKYTQDESYYFLEAGENAFVYLGLKQGISSQEMIADLESAQQPGTGFDADKYVEKWPIVKHDHVLIPAGTVHCSGANSVVLEISATPYIFTFKLWDWERMGLDGKPRPISLRHGANSIQWDRTTSWTKDNLINQVEQVAKGDGWIEERTGLHEGSFIETRRHWFTELVQHDTGGVVNVLNLVEGREVLVESPTNAFAPFPVHYAETFIIPAHVGAYTIRPVGESAGTRCGTMKAFINIDNLPL